MGLLSFVGSCGGDVVRRWWAKAPEAVSSRHSDAQQTRWARHQSP